jgi:hypothetical protein
MLTVTMIWKHGAMVGAPLHCQRSRKPRAQLRVLKKTPSELESKTSKIRGFLLRMTAFVAEHSIFRKRITSKTGLSFGVRAQNALRGQTVPQEMEFLSKRSSQSPAISDEA